MPLPEPPCAEAVGGIADFLMLPRAAEYLAIPVADTPQFDIYRFLEGRYYWQRGCHKDELDALLKTL